MEADTKSLKSIDGLGLGKITELEPFQSQLMPRSRQFERDRKGHTAKKKTA
jgi:hypothetical protein